MSLRTEWLNHALGRRLADSNRCKASRRNEHVNAPERVRCDSYRAHPDPLEQAETRMVACVRRPELDTLASLRAAEGGSSRSYVLVPSSAASEGSTPALPAPDGSTPSSASPMSGGAGCSAHGSPECRCTTTYEPWGISRAQTLDAPPEQGIIPPLRANPNCHAGDAVLIFSAEDSPARTSGLLSSNGGRDFGVVLGTLADLGYGLGWRVLDSRFFGVPQRRRRVFIVGTLVDGDPRAAAERAGQVLAVGSRCPRHPATRGEAGQDVAGTLGGVAGSHGWAQDTERMTFVPVANTLKSQRGKAGGGIGPEETLIAAPLSHGSNPNSNAAGRRREDDFNLVTAFHQTQDLIHGDEFSPALGVTSLGMAVAVPLDLRNGLRADGDTGVGTPGSGVGIDGDPAYGVGSVTQAVATSASVRRLTPTECERLQGLPDGWTNPDGTAPDSRRYAGLGDAVTATVGHWIGARIRAADEAAA